MLTKLPIPSPNPPDGNYDLQNVVPHLKVALAFLTAWLSLKSDVINGNIPKESVANACLKYDL